MAAGIGAKNIEFENNYRIFFSEDNPQLQAFDGLQRVYTKDDSILFVLEPATGTIIEGEFLGAVEWLTHEAWKLPYTTRVDSLTNFQHTESEGDDLFVDDLVSNGPSLEQDELQKILGVGLSEPLLYNRILNDESRVTAVNAVLTFPEESITEVPEAAAAARELADRFGERYPGVEVYISGMVMLNNAFAESSITDMTTIVPLMYLGVIITMVILVRSFAGTVGTLFVILFSSATAIGLMGWLGIGMSPPVSTAPTMIMTLAIADSIHLLVTYLRERRLGRSRESAIVESLRVNFQPILLTSVTTAIGFLSLNFSDAPPFRDLGNVVAMGVMFAWIFSVFFLPALLAVLPSSVRAGEVRSNAFFDRLSDSIIRHRRRYLWTSVAIVALLAAFIPKNELNDQWVDYFDHRIEFRGDTDFIMENLAGIYSVEFSLPAEGSGGISEPSYLAKLDEFSAWWRAKPGVRQVVSLSDTMKRLNKNMHGDDPEYYRIPEERNLAAQYLLLYEMSLPFGLDLNNQINVDKSSTRFTVTIGNISTVEVRRMIAEGETWLRDNAPETMWVYAASPTVMFAYISERNIKSMLGGTLLALVIISGLLAVSLKSIRFGVISLIPNLLPAVAGFGLWGLFVSEIGMSLSIVIGMTLGIVVDDTVHFLSKYLRARREKNLEAGEAVRYAFQAVGKALFVTTVILTVGFAILSFSSFRLNSWMGQLTAIVIVCALLADFFLLPAVLLTLDRKREKRLAHKLVGEETLFPESALAG